MQRDRLNRWRRRWTPLLLAAAAPLLNGCGFDVPYVLGAAAGQLNLLAKARPIDEAIASGDLPPETEAKLSVILDVRAYAGDVLSLHVGDNFQKWYDSQGEPVLFNISASRKDAFAPYTWSFPFVGSFPYIGYFNAAAANKEFDKLVADGYDAWMYEVDAYSGISVIPNLILSPMLKRPDISIVETVIHELLHSTVWKANATSFNESLATFYGRTGAVQYLRDRYPDNPELIQEAMDYYEDTDRFANFLLSVYDDLDMLFQSDLTPEEKAAGRAEVIAAADQRFADDVLPLMHVPENYQWATDLPVNNAWMLGIRRYNLELGVFQQVFEATGEDWNAALEWFQTASKVDDPYTYLQERLANTEPSSRDVKTNRSTYSSRFNSVEALAHRRGVAVPARRGLR